MGDQTENMENGLTVVRRYCPNCGCIQNGYPLEDDRLRFDCPQCKLISVVVRMNRRNSTVQEYLPKYWKLLNDEDEDEDDLLPAKY